MTVKGTQGWASWAIAALAGGAVAAGLVLAGGPVQARKERRDDARVEDLQRLAAHIDCLASESAERRLPADLASTPGCPGPVPLADSRTGQPYRIEPLDAGRYRLCAAFELPATVRRLWDPALRDGDCLIHELPRPLPDDAAGADRTAADPLR